MRKIIGNEKGVADVLVGALVLWAALTLFGLSTEYDVVAESDNVQVEQAQ